MAIVTNIDPEDIPDVPVNKFLLRGNAADKDDKNQKDSPDGKAYKDRRGKSYYHIKNHTLTSILEILKIFFQFLKNL